MTERVRDETLSREGMNAGIPDWPVDVQRTDASGEVDLGQLEFNLSLTLLQRIEQNDSWVEFIHMARHAGQHLHARQTAP